MGPCLVIWGWGVFRLCAVCEEVPSCCSTMGQTLFQAANTLSGSDDLCCIWVVHHHGALHGCALSCWCAAHGPIRSILLHCELCCIGSDASRSYATASCVLAAPYCMPTRRLL